MTMGGEARGVVRVKKVHRAIAVEVRSPIVRVDQHRSRRHGSYIRHCPHHLPPRQCWWVWGRPIAWARGTTSTWCAPWLQLLWCWVSSKAETFADWRPVRSSRVGFTDVKASRLICTLGA